MSTLHYLIRIACPSLTILTRLTVSRVLSLPSSTSGDCSRRQILWRHCRTPFRLNLRFATRYYINSRARSTSNRAKSSRAGMTSRVVACTKISDVGLW